MLMYNKDMMILIGVAKFIFKASLAWLGTVALFQNIDQDFFDLLTSGTPSMIAQYLGFIYLLFIVVRKGIDLWERWQLARSNVKKGKEEFKQAEIKTKEKLKKLE